MIGPSSWPRTLRLDVRLGGVTVGYRDPPAVVVLAAGESSRMRGEDKLLREIDGTPLILRAVRAACAVSAHVVVTLPPGPQRAAWLTDLPARRVVVPERTMSASIGAGVRASRPGAVLLHLADMPEIGAEDLHALCDAWRDASAPILRAAAADGTPGHPVIFDAGLRARLQSLQGDVGARDVLRAHPVELQRLPGRRALVDLDTPEEWAIWMAGRVGSI